jgi:hypothetical protein
VRTDALRWALLDAVPPSARVDRKVTLDILTSSCEALSSAHLDSYPMFSLESAPRRSPRTRDAAFGFDAWLVPRESSYYSESGRDVAAAFECSRRVERDDEVRGEYVITTFKSNIGLVAPSATTCYHPGRRPSAYPCIYCTCPCHHYDLAMLIASRCPSSDYGLPCVTSTVRTPRSRSVLTSKMSVLTHVGGYGC